MANQNGTQEILDTRMELHILEYELRMVSIAKNAIANYTYYLIKICMLPQSRPGFFSFTETKDEYSITLEESVFEELPKTEGLTYSDSVWNVFTVSPGAMGISETTGISKIVNSIIVPLADNDISLFCMSTYQGDFILVKKIDLPAAVRCLSGSFKIFHEGGYHNLAPPFNSSTPHLNHDDPAGTSHPLVHAIVSPLNDFHVISLNSHYFSCLIPTLIDLMFYSSTRTSPKEGYETFFHFSFIDGDLSVVLDAEALSKIPSKYVYTSLLREQWRIIKIGDHPLGFDECGIVAQIAKPLVDAKITTFYISSCNLGHTLVPKVDVTKALNILNERKK